ncbi:YdbH domain-containing protein [uncultured Shewanella sp.]|uniref:YdbH domain-containing protein n=1 Tax=uncultured Shewanella sp. TaxID=173975 RepID=UPI002634B98C|nr:YdbH domain-containing protein [uncultured Shewanella sp.]
MAVRIFTVKRLFLFCFFLIALGLLLLQQNFRPIALNFVNSLTLPYNIEVIDVEVKDVEIDVTELSKYKLSDLNQLSLPWLQMRYQDSLIELQDIRLNLKDGYNTLKSMSLSVEDIRELHIGDINVTLGKSFITRQEQGENSDDIGLSLNQIPQISLDNISVYLPKSLQAKIPFPIIQTHNLKLEQAKVSDIKHTLSGELSLMEHSVSLFDLKMKQTQWVLNHQSDIATLISALSGLNQALYIAWQDNRFHQPGANSADNNSIIKPEKPQLIDAIETILGPIEDLKLMVNGKWKSQTELDLIHGSILSQHQIIPISSQAQIVNQSVFIPMVSSELLPNIDFSPEDTLAFSIIYAPEKELSPDKVPTPQQEKSIATLMFNLQPFLWQISTSQRQLTDIIALLDDPEINHQLQPFLAELKQEIDWSLALEQPLTIEMPLNTPSLINVMETDIKFSIAHPIASSTLKINKLSATSLPISSINNITENDGGALQLTSQLDLTINQHQTFDLIAAKNLATAKKTNHQISHGLTEPHKSESVNNSIFVAGSQINLSAKMSVKDHLAELILLPQSAVQTQQLHMQLSHNSLVFDQLHWRLEKQSVISLTKPLSPISKQSSIISSTEAESKFTIADFKLGFDSFAYTVNDEKQLTTEKFEVHLGQFEINAQQNIELLARSNADYDSETDNEQQPLIEQILAQTNQTQLDWHLSDVRIDKLIPSKSKLRRYKVLRLDDVTLKQTLALQQQLLTGTEYWQLDELNLSSYHLLRLPQQGMPVSLAGQWQVDTDLHSVISTLGQTQMLPENLTISGHNKLNAGFALNESQGVSLFEMKFEQQLSQLDAQYNENFFYDANLTSDCQFNWQQVHSTPSQPTTYSQSRLLCQKAELNIADAYVGINLENIKLNANISLGKNDEIAAKNWLQEISGLSDTDINLTASGDLLDGEFLVPEFYVKLHDQSEGYFVLNGISLEALLAAQPQVGVYADGIFDGVLPASLVNGKVTIKGGHLAARQPGGLIQVSNNPALEQIRTTQPYLDFVVQALEHLEYSQLSSSFDMEDNGDALLKVQVKGKSEDIERPIHLNYSHEENLFQLYKSTQIGNQLQNDIERSVK